jgi:hypothetical protein
MEAIVPARYFYLQDHFRRAAPMIPSFNSRLCTRREHSRSHIRFITAIGLATSSLALIGVPAAAHDTPSGWAYDMECCSDHDCRPERSEVKATPLGWLITSTGEIIRYGDRRIHDSKDGEFHRCLMQRGVNGPGMTRCLYVPPMSQ